MKNHKQFVIFRLFRRFYSKNHTG